nr:MAG TPA: hypothetical protein [Caudoviricetes sp.]
MLCANGVYCSGFSVYNVGITVIITSLNFLTISFSLKKCTNYAYVFCIYFTCKKYK